MLHTLQASVDNTLPSEDGQTMLSSLDAVLDSVQSRDSEEHADVLKAIADVLMKKYKVTHSIEVLKEAVSVYEQVLQLRPVGHERRAEALVDLDEPLYYLCSFDRADDARVQQTLELLREAVQLSPSNASRDRALHNLARFLLSVEYETRSGDLGVLAECVLLNREALQLRADGHPERHKSLNNLALALLRSFERCGDPNLLAECIHLNREVLQFRKPGHPHRYSSLNNLSDALCQQASYQGGLGALAESDSLLREALTLRPPSHYAHFVALGNLAKSLHMRYELQALPAALSEAIVLQRKACGLVPITHPARPTLADDLADSLVANFRLRGDVASITEAIALLRQTLLLRPLENHHRHHALSILADALLANFRVCRDTGSLLEAVSLQREALNMRPFGHSHRLESLHSLGRLLCEPECRSWDEAHAIFHEAVKSCPAGYAARSLLLSDMSKYFLNPASPFFNLAKGISHLSEGYSDELSHVNQRLVQAVLDLQQVEAAYTESMKGADGTTKDHHSISILGLYAQVIGLLPRAANFGLDHRTRLQVITGSDEITRDAAARALMLRHLSQAVELLEEGRGIFWSQTLHLRTTGFDCIPDTERDSFLRLLRMLEHGARTAESSGHTVAQREEALERRRQLNDEVEALISRIRTYPGCARFLMPAAFDSLLSGLPDGFVVILNASKLAHHALIFHKATGLAAGLELEQSSTNFDWTTLRARLPRDMESQPEQQSERSTRAMRMDSGNASESFEHVLFQLWTLLVEPVTRKLGLQKAFGHDRPRLWWCVTGELGFLPIHAAGKYRGTSSVCTADFVVSSYIPTLSSLTKARSGFNPIPRSSIAGLLICETYTDDGLLRHLPGASQEICLVRECFVAAHACVLNNPSPHTSLAELHSALDGTPAHILHLACHGVQDADPLSSALVMQDGKLTIEDMLQLDLPQAVFAYLSACQTAKGDRNVPDQAVHLAASMLFCGFRSVIGTMWLMHDEDGPELARRFYDALFANEALELDGIAYALDEAVQGLRKQGMPTQRWASFMHMGG